MLMLPQFLSDVSNIDPERLKVVPPLVASAEDLDLDGVHLKPAALQRLLDLLLVTFRDGIFVRPQDYPISEDLRKLESLFFFIFKCPCRCATPAIRACLAHWWVTTSTMSWRHIGSIVLNSD